MRKIVKCVIAGDGGVGKTTLVSQITGTFGNREIRVTPGLDVDIYHLSNEITMQIWDLGGQEQFRPMQRDFIRKADIIFYVYNVEWYHSFLNLDKWINFIATVIDPKLQYLIGNKIDTESRAISTKEGQEMAENLELRFFEISALNNIGIKEVIADIQLELDKILNNSLNLLI